MKPWLEKLFGIDKIRAEAKQAAEEALQIAEDAKQEAANAIAEAKKAKEEEAIAKMSPKDRATAKGEPWVGVLDTHVNKDNIKNGFFELDWNELFIEQLIKNGYGTEHDNHEDIVDRWFRELCANVVVDGDWEEFANSMRAGSVDGSTINANKK